jgi:hypothetical protein
MTPPAPDSDATAPPGRREAEPSAPPQPVEVGGRRGPEPTRYGDWEKDGRCIDF